MATINITYTAISAPVAEPVAQICATYVPRNAAADLPAFDGTYYDTNVWGDGGNEEMVKFITSSVAHPGLVLALKMAFETGEYEFETTDADLIAYLTEVTDAVADQGFVITVTTE